MKTALVCALALMAQAHAAEADRPRRGPPPAALAACADKKVGDACEMTFGEFTLAGQCVAGDGKLACRPEPKRENPGVGWVDAQRPGHLAPAAGPRDG